MFRRLADLDPSVFQPTDVFPSPISWQDEVLYFALVDRFSDGNEDGVKDVAGNVLNGTTPLYQKANGGNAVTTTADASIWREAGRNFLGGNLRGIRSSLGYLKRLGVTAIWISPVLKQVARGNTYHGYGVQDFLQVDTRFGSEQDLRDLVQAAHDIGIRVILDIILNHSGDVFAYQDGEPNWTGVPFPVRGFRDQSLTASLPFTAPDAADPTTWPNADSAIWPLELQAPETFTCEGRIRDFDRNPAEFRRGDFFALKDIRHGAGDVANYTASPALLNLCRAYEYWIATADLDGFRIDTVKHMDEGATRLLTARIREFTRSIGKSNFYLIGEVGDHWNLRFTPCGSRAWMACLASKKRQIY